MNRERLEKLAEHLESGELGHERFDFSRWNSGHKPQCGTAGCAIGECPIVWPDDWTFGPMGEPELRVNASFVSACGREWFDLHLYEFDHLFRPGCQDPNSYGGQYLKGDATRYDVAANIRAFIARQEATE